MPKHLYLTGITDPSLYVLVIKSLIFWDCNTATKDAILLESADESNPYVNIVACQKGHENDKKIKALIAVLQSKKIKEFITNTNSDGSMIPIK